MGCSGSKATNVATSEPTTEQQCDDTMPTIYVNHLSPVSRACVMVTCELEVNVTIKEVDIMAGEQHSEWFQEINAEHTVPAMTHGDVTLCQSSDIARYLVTTFAKGHKLYPDHEETRCKIDEFLEYCQTDLLPHVKEIVTAKFEDRASPEETVVIVKAQFVHINGVLGNNDYLTGDNLTLADLFVFSLFANVLLDPTFVKPNECDALNAWSQRIRALPYFASTHKTYFSVRKTFAIKVTGESPAEEAPEECPTEVTPEECPTEEVPEECPTEEVPEECPTEETQEECPAPDVAEECPTIYINWGSAICRSVMMISAELNIKINVKEVDIMKGEQKTEEYMAINPNCTVPTLVDGETIICESREISVHLVKKFSAGHALYPDDDEIKQKIDEILAYEKDVICPIVARLAHPIINGEESAGAEVHAEMHATMVHINGVIGENVYLTGASVTIVDVFVFNDFHQATLDQSFEHPEGCEAVSAWLARMEELTCVQTHHNQFIAVKQTTITITKSE